MYQISINSGTFNFRTNLGLTSGKYFIKISFDIKIEIDTFEISNVSSSINYKHFSFWSNLTTTGGKYLIKNIFDIKIEISILQILDV